MSTLTDPTAMLAQPWNYWFSALRSFFPFNMAPRSLDQSILPWTFAGMIVNENNSSDPATEHAIVSKDSYGRQLGRISDALECLIEALPESERRAGAVQDFLDMKARIDAIKRKADAARFDKVLADLEALRQSDEPRFLARIERINALAGK
jgi:hypothetical protein